MAEAATQIRHVNIAAGQRGRSENNRGMLVIALLETAWQRSEAFAIQLNRGTHLHQWLRETETILIHRFVHDRQALRLRQRHHQRLLPVGHEARMHVGFDRDRLQIAARMPETNAVIGDVELTTNLAEHVQERHHFRLRSTLDENVAMRGQCRGSPRSGLDAVGQRSVRVTLQFLHAFDAERTVHIHGNDRAHLLQHAHQIHDFRFGGSAGKLRLALSKHGGKQRLLGSAHRRVRQVNLRAMQTVRSGDMNAVLMFLIDVGTQLAQRFQVEINRTTANIASAESRNERLTQTVQQRAGEQNRNTRRTRQRIHVGHIGKLHIRGVDRDHAVIAIHRNVHAMQTQQVGDHMHVANLRNILQHGRTRGEQRRHHGLAHEVLRATHLDGAVQRLATFDVQNVVVVVRHAQPLSLPLYGSSLKHTNPQFAIRHVVGS